jgi:hypothetical protein
MRSSEDLRLENLQAEVQRGKEVASGYGSEEDEIAAGLNSNARRVNRDRENGKRMPMAANSHLNRLAHSFIRLKAEIRREEWERFEGGLPRLGVVEYIRRYGDGGSDRPDPPMNTIQIEREAASGWNELKERGREEIGREQREAEQAAAADAAYEAGESIEEKPEVDDLEEAA